MIAVLRPSRAPSAEGSAAFAACVRLLGRLLGLRGGFVLGHASAFRAFGGALLAHGSLLCGGLLWCHGGAVCANFGGLVEVFSVFGRHFRSFSSAVIIASRHESLWREDKASRLKGLIERKMVALKNAVMIAGDSR
jgi:hypothetical protein